MRRWSPIVAGFAAAVLALAPGTAQATTSIAPAGDGAIPAGAFGAAASGAEARAAATAVRGAARRGRARPPRRGGKVRAAWPHRRGAKAPRARLARWLARHTGPTKAARRGRRRPISTLPARHGPAAPTAVAQSGRPLLLVRSFDIPARDPHAASLTNLSWTYDNALATFAFLSGGERAAAEQLLDQLKALQRADGSLDFAYDVSSGDGAGRARTGAMAWVALAAVAYRRQYDNSRYDALIAGVVDHVLGLRTAGGLVRGGSDVGWISTQHNLLTVGMLRDLVDQLGPDTRSFGGYTVAELRAIERTIGDAIVAKLLVERGGEVFFRGGVGDDAVPLDVQALGALYLHVRGDRRAAQVAAHALSGGFRVGPRLLRDGRGPFSGYRPYADAGSPNVIWTEGTFQLAHALRRIGVDSVETELAVAALRRTTANGTVAPIGADRDTETRWGEFHTWPASAAASWMLVLGSSRQLLFTR